METVFVTNTVARVDLEHGEVSTLLEALPKLDQAAMPLERREAAELLQQQLEAALHAIARDPDWSTGRAADVDYASVVTRHDLSEMVSQMRADLLAHPETWENHSLGRFLGSLSAYIDDVDGYFRNQGKEIPDPPTWQLFALILTAASGYE